MLHRKPGHLVAIASRLMLVAVLVAPLAACSTLSSLWPWSGSDEDTDKPEDPASVPVEEMYNRGVDAMNAKRYAVAAKQFDLVEQTYPYSSWAVNAQLMQGYSQYLQNHYTDAIGTLDRFIQLHPAHRDIAYAYYLRGLCFYEQISDIRRDQKATQEAIGALQEVVNRFPDSAYARDARLKIDLGRDHLAGKEMEIGRWYEREHLYTAAIGRFQRVVDDYQTTNHVAEALHRLTEIYLKLGLTDEARRTAAVLGHNYPGSPWYENSYNDLVSVGEVNPPMTVAAKAPPAARPATDQARPVAAPAQPVVTQGPPVVAPAPPVTVQAQPLTAPGQPATAQAPPAAAQAQPAPGQAAPAAVQTPPAAGQVQPAAAQTQTGQTGQTDETDHPGFFSRVWNSVF